MSWLSNLFHRFQGSDSVELTNAKEQAALSEQRLHEVNARTPRIDRVANSLQIKQQRNGWGEVIAETMKRADR